ncbi:molybdopterin-guanine dinucleotide biosynthesis protein A [Gramella sp. Hel_I_59]|nr:molybdopterin-guanine dinucleotide biosynthesis protein A [Gramella sp. Hel_I_59]
MKVIRKKAIEVFILAGGESRRMGTDKGLLNFKGTPMILHIIKLLNKLDLKTSIISSNQEYLKFGKPLYTDIIPKKGPLGGLYTALEYSNASMVLLLACDMPSINEEAIQSLMTLAEAGKITVATDSERITPLFACYPKSLKEKVEKAILADELKMQDFITRQSHVMLDLNALENTEVLQNLNTQEQLKAAENTETDGE